MGPQLGKGGTKHCATYTLTVRKLNELKGPRLHAMETRFLRPAEACVGRRSQ